MTQNELHALHRLAELHGVQLQYRDAWNRRITPCPESVLACVRALGAECETLDEALSALRARERHLADQMLEPSSVAWNGRISSLRLNLPRALRARPFRLRLRNAQGEAAWVREGTLAELGEVGPEDGHGRCPLELGPAIAGPTGEQPAAQEAGLAFGVYRLELEVGETRARSHLLVAPTRCWTPNREASFGVFAPLYAVRSEAQDLGPSLADLDTLRAWLAELGGSFVGTLPMLASFLDTPFDPSPYAPVSRLFWNELFLDLERLPELASSELARRRLRSPDVIRERQALAELPLFDYRRQMALKRTVLEPLAQACFASHGAEHEALETALASDPNLDAYARFRATVERRGCSWHRWQTRASGAKQALQAGAFELPAYRYHAYVQWRMRQQLQALSARGRASGCGLYLDLPLGAHPDGFDTWRQPELFVWGASAGAPPDLFFTRGQNWGFPLLRPDALRKSGYAYVRACLQSHLEYSQVLRIDHVMGLHRLFCVPLGMPASEGTYIRYPAEELYALLCLESHRHKTLVVGEDLGTVPESVRQAMARHKLQRMYTVQFELSPERPRLARIPARAFASLNTHDMPTFAGFWQGRDIDDRAELGLLAHGAEAQAHRERRRLCAALWQHYGLPQQRALKQPPRARTSPEGTQAATEAGSTHAGCRLTLRGLLAELAASPAQALVVNLEDLWSEADPHNVPGTTHQRPNWRRRMRHSLESLCQLPEVTEPLLAIARLRAGHARMPKEAPMPPSTLLSELDLHLFNEGTHAKLYEKMGAHLRQMDGVSGTHFSVWAPNAERVSLVSDTNNWNPDATPLQARGASGIWEGFVPGIGPGTLYKYRIEARDNGYCVNKADPFGFQHETPPRTASVVTDLEYHWGDHEWMTTRAHANALNAPISIYELHVGSWRKRSGRPLGYRELAPELVAYLKQMGFTHVELLPVMEHPYGRSWGYQVTGYFAASSRWGSPQDLMFFVDCLHQHGIGVILDWVPAHFPADEHGLGYFDGTHLYEHEDPRLGFHPDWKSCIFNYGRHEVRSFLQSSALFWLDKYHVDGLRVDGVASMLYRDYSRRAGEWVPNEYGGRENLEAIQLLRRVNQVVYEHFPDVQTIAEESTAWPMVSRPTYLGGLGFGLKWDMGWMHDTLHYLRRDPIHRRYHHNELTFRALYAFHENFVLPLSHDEVVHGKGSLLQQMPGDEWQRFANLRLLFACMFAQPGKKLSFMGGEFGQWREWDCETSLDWHLTDHERHQALQRMVAGLNHMYRTEPALHELDTEAEGFGWVEPSDSGQSVFVFSRRGSAPERKVVVVLNCTPVPRHDYRVGVERPGVWQELFNTDATEFGGSGVGNGGSIDASRQGFHGRPYSLELTLPPLGALFLRHAAWTNQ